MVYSACGETGGTRTVKSKGTVFDDDDDEAVLDSLKASLETVGFTVEVYQAGFDCRLECL